MKREATLNDNIQHAYSLILGQCTDLLQSKLKQQATWGTVSTNRDGIALVGLIKSIIYKFDDQNFLPLALYNMKLNFFLLRQGNMTNNKYLKKFNMLVDVTKSY